MNGSHGATPQHLGGVVGLVSQINHEETVVR